MAFWKGVKKIISGLEDIVCTPVELLVDLKQLGRIALSGKYTVRIPTILPVLYWKHPRLVAHISFDGDTNRHDIDLITYENGTTDVWDELNDRAKSDVQFEINCFLNDLMDKYWVSPYH